MKQKEQINLPFEDFLKDPTNEEKTSIIYRGGKSSLTDWILPYFPPHRIFVDCFGGGGAVTFAKGPSEVDVYNDIGDVSRFFSVLRDQGDELYRSLYFAPWSREYFHECFKRKIEIEDDSVMSWIDMEDEERLEWAHCWYVTLMQSFRHEEDDNSWLMSKGSNGAENFRRHTDNLPALVKRLKSIVIEHGSYDRVIRGYDSKDTLFYADPPYLPGTWDTEKGGYRNVMSIKEHEELLRMLIECQGQVIVSGYPSDLYDNFLSGWKRVSKERMGGIKNSSQVSTKRTEVLWIKEHHETIWSTADEDGSQTDVARILAAQSDAAAIATFRKRNGLQ